MGKLIFIIIVVLVAYWIIKGRQHVKTQADKRSDAIEDMVSCAHCGIHLPKSESIVSQGKFFCSDDHHHQHIDLSS